MPPSPTGPFFGAAFGQLVVSGSPVAIVNGLTTAPYLHISNAANSVGIIYVGDANVTTTRGFVLEPGKSAILDNNSSRNRWYATTDGITARLSWIATSGQ